MKVQLLNKHLNLKRRGKGRRGGEGWGGKGRGGEGRGGEMCASWPWIVSYLPPSLHSNRLQSLSGGTDGWWPKIQNTGLTSY